MAKVCDGEGCWDETGPFKRARVKVRQGRSNTNSIYFNNKGRSSYRGSTTGRSTYIDRYLCPDCYAALAKRNGLPNFGCFITALLVVGVFVFSAMNPRHEKVNIPTQKSLTAINQGAAALRDDSTIAPTEPVTVGDQSRLERTPSVSKDTIFQDDQVSAAQDAAVIKALRDGEPAYWHKNGQKGYAVISPPQEADGQICRNVAVTTSSDGTEMRKPARRWCRTAIDTNWTPAEN